MIHTVQGENVRTSWFGQRRLTPRACVADRKKHVRTFLAEALEDVGFITGECAHASELDDALDDQHPDLLVFGASVDGMEISRIIETLARKDYAGKVLIVGSPQSIMMKAVRQICDEHGIAMLPPLP